jgi:hypothetical protein
MPDWGETRDAIVYPDGDGGAVLEYLDEESVFDPGVRWPARFGSAGRYLYGATQASTRAAPETLIFDIETGESETLPGEALYSQLPVEHVSIGATSDGFIAVLPGPLYCRGMQIYANGGPLICIDGGQAPSFSPDGKYVALAKKTGEHTNGGIFDIVLVEVASGRQQTVVEDVRSNIPYPIPVAWNDASTHILVRSPHEYGPYWP